MFYRTCEKDDEGEKQGRENWQVAYKYNFITQLELHLFIPQKILYLADPLKKLTNKQIERGYIILIFCIGLI